MSLITQYTMSGGCQVGWLKCLLWLVGNKHLKQVEVFGNYVTWSKVSMETPKKLSRDIVMPKYSLLKTPVPRNCLSHFLLGLSMSNNNPFNDVCIVLTCTVVFENNKLNIPVHTYASCTIALKFSRLLKRI